MTADHSPTCPFCHAQWTQAMLDEYDRFSVATVCGCSHGDHHAHVAVRPPVPARDLCCTSCGNTIYRKP